MISINPKYHDFVNEKLGGEDNLESLVASIIEYHYLDDSEILPAYDKDLNLPMPTPVVAIGITEISEDTLILEMVHSSIKLVACFSPSVVSILRGVQEMMYDNPKCAWSDEEIEKFEFIKGKNCLIGVENSMIYKFRLLPHDQIAPIIRDFVERNINISEEEMVDLSENYDAK